MAQSRYEYGESVEVFADFKTSKKSVTPPPNTLIDPAAVTLTIRKPDKTVETRTYGVSGITRIETGKYKASIALTQEGTYHWRWKGDSGPNQVGVQTGSFDSVREPDF